MQTARRLYVYLLSGIALGVLVVGVSMLLTVLFDALGLRSGGDVIFGNEDTMRQQLTLASALTVVSLPLWLAHWIAAERSVAIARPTAAVERNSDVRGMYFAIAMSALLLAAGLALRGLIETAVFAVAGGTDEFSYRNPAGDLALFIAAGGAWAYHVAIRARDWRVGPLEGPGAYLPRFYLYLATFVSLLVLLFGLTGLVELVGRLILDEPAFGQAEGSWWAYPLATSVSSALVGGGIWIGHWLFADRQLRDPGWRGASERPARLRLAYYLLVIVVTAAVALAQLSSGVAAGLRAAFGVSEASEAGQIVGLVLLPLLGAAIFGAACWFHRRWLADEAEAVAVDDRVRTAGRLQEYGTALVGLAFAAVGVSGLIGVVLNAILTGGRTFGGGDLLPIELAANLPMALFGAALWIWSWGAASRRHAAAPADEAASTSRRAALLIVLAVSVLAGIASLGVILYRVFGAAFGLAMSGDAAAELSRPIAVLLIAVAVGLYHLGVLRRDQALRASAEPEVAAPVVVDAATAAVVVLRLTGPTGSDTGAAAAALRAHLPPGYSLEVVER
ncbi:MAG: DUF5671 domain-containing protein [Candidatus Limnocylindria bacterium]